MVPFFTGQLVGQLTGFSTDDPIYTCLESGPSPPVYLESGASGVYIVETSTPADCAQGIWELVAQPPVGGSGAS
jgi:hypothetical protein